MEISLVLQAAEPVGLNTVEKTNRGQFDNKDLCGGETSYLTN